MRSRFCASLCFQSHRREQATGQARRDRRRGQRDGDEVVRRALERTRVERDEQGRSEVRARRLQGQRGCRRHQAHRALLLRLPLERRLRLRCADAARRAPFRSRRQSRLSGGDRVAARLPVRERRRRQHRFEECGRAHRREHRAGRAPARRFGRDDRDHRQRSRLHAARVRRLLRRRLQGARRSRPRRRRLQRDAGAGVRSHAQPGRTAAAVRSRTRRTTPRCSGQARPTPPTARTSPASQRPTAAATPTTARSSASRREPSCWPTASSAATAARTATS